jgi:hypothetical protein
MRKIDKFKTHNDSLLPLKKNKSIGMCSLGFALIKK